MVSCNPFLLPGHWFKGALHVHTTCSDGRLSPADVVALYRSRGYHFVVITDHNRRTDVSGLSAPGFLVIPGVELGWGCNELGQPYHFVLAGLRGELSWPVELSIERVVAHLRGLAPLVLLAHPYWSGMTVAEMAALEGVAGLEVYNTSAETDLGKGLSSVHWDDLLARGKRWWGYAVDDSHGINDDLDGGWVWVKAGSLSEESVLSALAAGAFYSSSGPEIHDFRLEGEVATVRCSPVQRINFLGQAQWGFQRRAGQGDGLSCAEYRLCGRELYLRVECIDAHGRTAWTNPLFLS
jgi:hypothetical protein